MSESSTGFKVAVVGLEVDVLKGGDGPPLVVLHRDTGRAGWSEFHAQLAESFTVHAPSLPGFDDSTRPAWMRSVAELATVTGLLVDQLGCAPCPIVGLGFGGWVGAEAAVQNPQRFTGLVLHSPVGLQPSTGEIVDQFLYSAKDYVRMGFTDSARFDALFGTADDEPLLRRWDLNREMTTRIAWKPYMFSRSLPGLLPALRIPALVLHSSDDRIVPRSVSERYAALLAGSRLVDLAGAGHQGDLESPSGLANQVKSFLS